jgi:hypothetical protein
MRARYEQAHADAEAFEEALQRAQDYHDVRTQSVLSLSPLPSFLFVQLNDARDQHSSVPVHHSGTAARRCAVAGSSFS